MRLSISKSKNTENFYINFSYINEKGVNTSKIYKKLGNLEQLKKQLNTDNRDEVIAWCKEQARIETEQYKKEKEEVRIPFSPDKLINLNEQRSFNCGYLFLQCIYRDLRFDRILRNIRNRHCYEYDLNAILSDLIFARILSPSSKNSSFDFCKSLLEQPSYELYDVYRSLSVLAEESDYIQSEIFRNSQLVHKRNTSVLYYDCTNYYFEIEQESGMKKYGKSKENRPNPIIGMGLFMDRDGFPLAFELHPGNQNEQTTLKEIEKKVIRDFDCSEFIYCSDSGLGSQSNKLLNDVGGRGYVITQSLKKLKEEDRVNALNPSGFRLIGSKELFNLDEIDEDEPAYQNAIFYKMIPIESKKLSETLLVTYSIKYKKYQKKIRDGQIERAKKMITDGGKPKKNRKNPNDPARFLTCTSITENGEIANQECVSLNDEKIEEEAKYDGFYAVSTDMEASAEELIKVSDRRWQIEECFRIMKTDFEARPVFLQRDDRIKAHFLICFLSLLIYRILEEQLGKKYTVTEIINTLREMRLTKLEAYGYIPSYTRTELTDELHKLYGFHTDTQIIKKAKMRNIISLTKKK